MNTSDLEGDESRRGRMMRFILEFRDRFGRDFDDPKIKGKLIFDLGRIPGSGRPDVSGEFYPTPERL